MKSELESKSLNELRSIAQAVGLMPEWGTDKPHLIQQINERAAEKFRPPEKPLQVVINGNSDAVVTQKELVEKLKQFKDLGLELSFPDERTWEMECNGKRDSGSMTVSLWNIVQVAREIVKP